MQLGLEWPSDVVVSAVTVGEFGVHVQDRGDGRDAHALVLLA